MIIVQNETILFWMVLDEGFYSFDLYAVDGFFILLVPMRAFCLFDLMADEGFVIFICR